MRNNDTMAHMDEINGLIIPGGGHNDLLVNGEFSAYMKAVEFIINYAKL